MIAMAQDAPETKDEPKGLECPRCGCPESSVYYTRKRTLRVNGHVIGGKIRSRICDHCHHDYVTTEIITTK